MATRGSRRTFLSFWRPLAELKMMCSPSKSHHTGVTCGLPLGIRVPRLAKARFWKRSRYFSGMTSGIRPPRGRTMELTEHYRSKGEDRAEFAVAQPTRVFFETTDCNLARGEDRMRGKPLFIFAGLCGATESPAVSERNRRSGYFAARAVRALAGLLALMLLGSALGGAQTAKFPQ